MNRFFKNSAARLLTCGLLLSASGALAAPDTFGLGDGHSGAFTASSANQVVNAYAPLSAVAGPVLTLGTVTGTGTFAAGDLVLVWQTAGHTGATSGSATSIDLTGSTTVGRYEYARVVSFVAPALTLTSPLLTSFSTTATQVIRVPEFTTVTIGASNSLTAPAWNGSTGGIVAFLATGAVTVDGSVNVNGKGFRAGVAPTQDGSSNCLGDDGLPPQYGWKGEGIQATSYGALFGGRGNIANAGGGGNCHNGGGGGGGHAAAGGQAGGRWPDNADFGGKGGVRLITSIDILSFGGGGGAGHVNQSTGGNGAGGAGGGVVLVRALSIGGAGAWLANGNDAIDNPQPCDPGGGGGAGGLLHLRSASSLSCGSASARGGNGGSHGNCGSQYTTQAQGVGGGGAGGYAYLQAATTTCAPVLTGGPQGTSAGNTSVFAQPGGTGTPGTTPPGGFAVAVVTAPVNGSVTTNRRPALTATGTAGNTMFIYLDGVTTPVCSGIVSSGGSFSCTPTSDLSYAVHTVTAQVSPTGNVADATPMSPTVTFTIAPAPALTLNAVTPVNASNASAYAVSGTCVTGAGSVTITVTPVTVGPLTCTANAFSFSLNLSSLSDGPVTISATQTNIAGTSTDSKSTVKDTVVVAPVIGSPVNAATLAAGSTTISGTSEANAGITVFRGMAVLCTTTANASGNWSCSANLTAGSYTIDAVQADVAGNVSAPSTAVNFTVINAPVLAINTPAAINLANASAYPVSGTCTDTTTVNVSVGSVTTSTPCTSGLFSTTLNVASLADAAAVTITAAATNVAGNASVSRNVLKDTAIAPPAITAPAAASTVAPSPIISGNAEPGATVTVNEGMTVVCTTTASNSGTWSCTSTLAAGMHTLTATQRDLALNTSSASPSVSFTVAPVPAIALNPPAVINAANASTFPLAGSCTTAAGPVSLSVGTVTAMVPCTAGSFSTTLDVSGLADAASLTVQASQTNLGGTGTSTQTTRKDTVANAPVIAAPTAGSDVGSSPILSGTAEPAAVVTVKEGTTTLCTVTADASGNWSCASTFAVGAHTITASQVDTAGNASPASPTLTFNVGARPVVGVNQPVAIATANAATYPVSGTCTTGAGLVTVAVGSVMGSATCTAGTFSTSLDVSALNDGSTIAVTVSQTNVAGTGTDSKNTRKDTAVTAPIIIAPADTNVVGPNPSIAGTSEAGATVTVREGSTTVCTVTASSMGTWICPTTLAGGSHTIAATQTDTAGNVSPASANTTFTVITSPAVIVDAPGVINASNASAYTVSGLCILNAGTVTLSVGSVMSSAPCNGGTFSTTVNVSALSDGSMVTVTASQMNVAGSGTDSKSTRKDTQVAVPVITAPAAAANVAPNPMISGTAEANATVVVNEGSNTVCTTQASASGSWNCASTLTFGPHSITAIQTDTAGNVSPGSAATAFTVGAAPTVTLDMPAVIAAANASAYPVAGQCESTAGAVSITIGSVVVTTPCTTGRFSTTMNIGAVADASAVSIIASQTNGAGTGSDTKVTRKDTAANAPVVTAPVASSNVAANPTVRGTAEPGATVTVVEGTTTLCTATADAQGEWSCAVTLMPGSHSITTSQVDPSGNTSPSSTPTTFTVSDGPVVTVMAMAINSMNAGAFAVRGTCTTSAGSVTITIDTLSTTAPCTNGMYLGSLDVSALADAAAITVKASQTDASGTGEATTVVRKDTTLPDSPSVLVPAPGATVSSVPTISGRAEPNSQVTVSIDGVVIGTTNTDSNGSWSLTVQNTIGPGNHTVTATATDSVGNVSAPSATQSFKVISTSVTITSPTNDTTVPADASLAVTGTGPAGGTVTVLLDGASIGTAVVGSDGKWSFEIPGSRVTSGGHVITAQAGGAPSPAIKVTAEKQVLNSRYAGAGLGCSSSPGLMLLALLALVWVSRRRHPHRLQAEDPVN